MSSEDWVTVKEAQKATNRSRRTIYRWLAEDRVKTMRPMRVLYLYLPDLWQAVRDTNGRGKKNL